MRRQPNLGLGMLRPVYIEYGKTGGLAGPYADEWTGITLPQRAQCGRIRSRMFMAAGPGDRRRLLGAAWEARQPGRNRGLERDDHDQPSSRSPGQRRRTAETTPLLKRSLSARLSHSRMHT